MLEVLDPRLPTPLYYQLKEILSSKIDKGEWVPGQLIPTENELIQQYQVSRTTVREAIIALVNEGKLEKKQGKGTIVCHPKYEELLGRLTGFNEEMTSRGLVPGARVLEVKKLDALEIPKVVMDKLLTRKEEGAYYIKRVRLANGEPISIEETYWRSDLSRLFENEELTTEGYYTILEKNGIRLRDADEAISAAIADEETAALLGIDAGDPLLRVVRITNIAHGTPIEYSINHYRSDRYLYKVHLKR